MIISLRGASGAGKSTLARAIFEQYDEHREVFADGRKRPYYVVHGRSTPDNLRRRTLVTPGHYSIKNGGVDTLRSLQNAYDIARWADMRQWDVLMEGKCMSDGVRGVGSLMLIKADVRVVHIDTTFAQCVVSVRERGHRIAERSIMKTFLKIARDISEFQKIGVNVFSGSREQCREEIEKWLGLR